MLDIDRVAHPQRGPPASGCTELFELLDQTLVAAGVDPGHARVDLGDGVIVLLDPQLAATRVVEVVTGRLTASLAAQPAVARRRTAAAASRAAPR